MEGQPVEEKMHATGSVGARKSIMDWYQPRDDDESDYLKNV